MNYIARQIKRIRKAQEIPQATIAKKLNVSPATISLWESGSRHPSASHLKALAKIYKVPLEEITQPKKEEELKACTNVTDFKNTLEAKLEDEQLVELTVQLFEEHADNMMEETIRIVSSNEERKKHFLKGLIGI